MPNGRKRVKGIMWKYRYDYDTDTFEKDGIRTEIMVPAVMFIILAIAALVL